MTVASLKLLASGKATTGLGLCFLQIMRHNLHFWFRSTCFLISLSSILHSFNKESNLSLCGCEKCQGNFSAI